MTNRPPEPPRLATSLLRLCCTRAHREEIEGDLYELFARRAARLGIVRARQRYALDVGGVCVRQVSTRMNVALSRSKRVRRIVSIIGVVLAIATALIANQQRWAVMTGYALLLGLSVLELLVYARFALSILNALVGPARARTRSRSHRD